MVWSAAPSTTGKFLPPPVSTSLHKRPENPYVVRRHDLYALGCRYRRSKFGGCWGWSPSAVEIPFVYKLEVFHFHFDCAPCHAVFSVKFDVTRGPQ